MAKIVNNRPLFWTVVANLTYWTLGPFIPSPWVSSAASLFLMLASANMFMTYAPAAYDVLFYGRRDRETGGERSHIGVYGGALCSGGSCIVGLFGFLWVLAGQPDSWLGTVYSGYGRAVTACGFVLMAYSSAPRDPASSRARMIVAALLVTALAVASFYLGKHWSQPEQAAYWKSVKGVLANRPSCADTQPVWGSQNKVYHIEDSPYRGMVIPDWCFASTEEAEEKGFRSPKGARVD